MKIGIFILLLLGFSYQASAKEESFRVRQIAEGPLSPVELVAYEKTMREQCIERREGFDIQQLITLGKEIWQIVKDGAPTINFTSDVATVIPMGAECAFKMSNWSPPRSKTFEMVYKNKFGGEMIYFTYKVIYSFGGKFQGKGAYLANVSIHPVDIRLFWGQSFDAFVKTAKAINVGSDEEPVAGLEISLEWEIKNPVMETQAHRSYFVDGNGQLLAL
jgi:hypothetical protein